MKRLLSYGALNVLHLLIAIGLCACATPNSAADQFEISDLQVGKVCGPTGGGDICEQTYDIVLADQGRCVYDRQVENCTWFGFSFDYAKHPQNIVLDCQWMSDYARDNGNPEQVLGHGVRSGAFHLVLPAGQTHFFNPQYRAGRTPGIPMETETETCSYRGKTLFQFTLRFHGPGIDA